VKWVIVIATDIDLSTAELLSVAGGGDGGSDPFSIRDAPFVCMIGGERASDIGRITWNNRLRPRKGQLHTMEVKKYGVQANLKKICPGKREG
jgi:hypothetical protein